MNQKIIVLLLLLLSCLQGFAQNTEVTLEKFEPSQCLGDDEPYNLVDRIVFQEFTDSLFVIEISITANCCISEFGSINISEDTLKLFYEKQHDSVCDCNCCFSFKYYIKGLEQKEYVVLAENKIIEHSAQKYKIQPIRFDIVDGDTINYFDMYGFLQGIHISKNDEGNTFMERRYVDSRAIYSKEFYDSGELRFKTFNITDTFSYEIQYLKNGQVKSECDINFDAEIVYKCKEYDEQGNLIKE